MKQYLLFAGAEDSTTVGVQGLVGDFDSVAEAFLSLVDNQTPSEWWHVLDTRTGEVIERRHIRVSNGMIGFQRSDWVAGASEPAASTTIATAKGADLTELEAGLRAVVTNGIKKSNGHAEGHANGAAAEH
jgi:hypothetical protein